MSFDHYGSNAAGAGLWEFCPNFTLMGGDTIQVLDLSNPTALDGLRAVLLGEAQPEDGPLEAAILASAEDGLAIRLENLCQGTENLPSVRYWDILEEKRVWWPGSSIPPYHSRRLETLKIKSFAPSSVTLIVAECKVEQGLWSKTIHFCGKVWYPEMDTTGPGYDAEGYLTAGTRWLKFHRGDVEYSPGVVPRQSISWRHQRAIWEGHVPHL